jgi:hypothetical protein
MAFLLMTVLISYEVMKVGNLSPTTGLFLIIPVNNLPNWINVRCRPFSNCWTGLNVIWNFLSNTRIKNCCSFNPVLVSEQTFVKVSFYDDCAQRKPQEVMCCCKFTISKGSAWSNCVSNCKIQRQFCVRDRERERERDNIREERASCFSCKLYILHHSYRRFCVTWRRILPQLHFALQEDVKLLACCLNSDAAYGRYCAMKCRKTTNRIYYIRS